MSAQILEWAPFRLKDGLGEGELLAASDALQRDFLVAQDGFVRRELVHKGEGEYVDLVWWTSQEAAEAAMKRAAGSTACSTYFSIMTTDAADPGAGVLHFRSLRAY